MDAAHFGGQDGAMMPTRIVDWPDTILIRADFETFASLFDDAVDHRHVSVRTRQQIHRTCGRDDRQARCWMTYAYHENSRARVCDVDGGTMDG